MNVARCLYSLLIAVCLLSLQSCSWVSDTDGEVSSGRWSIFRGSPSLSGYTSTSLPSHPVLLWSVGNHTRTVASPIVYDSVVYTLSRRGQLYGYSFDGDSCLLRDFSIPIEASFLIRDSILYIGRIDGFISAYRLNDLTSGNPLWEYETLGQISGSPNLVEGQLLVGSYDNSMYTFDAQSGQKMSQFETGYYINGTASVWRRYMVFGGCDTWIRVVNTATGLLVDSLSLDSYMPASPAILDGAVCASDYNGNVYEFELDADGRIVSHRRLLEIAKTDDGDEGQGAVSMPALTPDAAYVLTGDRRLLCIDRSSATIRWQKLLRGITGECSPLVARDRVLVCTKDGHVSIFDAADGSELWYYEVGEQIIASPAIVAGRFFILTSRGTLLCFADARQ